jgi:hypothetical protein
LKIIATAVGYRKGIFGDELPGPPDYTKTNKRSHQGKNWSDTNNLERVENKIMKWYRYVECMGDKTWPKILLT